MIFWKYEMCIRDSKGIKPNEDVVYQKLKRYYLRGLQTGMKETEKALNKKTIEVEDKRKELKEKQVDRKRCV